jgi:hypothetical protein
MEGYDPMIMKVETIDVLTEEAHFDPQVARAIAKAIGMETDSAREPLAAKADIAAVKAAIVALGHDLRMEMRDLKVELIRWVFLTLMGFTATLSGVMYFLLQNIR